ncbi:histidine phosphatase superfamily [Mycena leptocephala]|nr:histidine phosphatase superfamily [Mycena leptocephala]
MQSPRVAALFATVWLGIAWLFVARNRSILTQSPSEFDIRKSWGPYSPFFSVHEYTPPPDGCEITQLERHGARFPTSGATINIVSAVRKLQSVEEYAHPAMEFLSSFVYTLGINDLVPFGALQSQESGASVYERYTNLVDADNLPFVRASSGVRVVNSANNWTAGFSAASHHKYNPSLSVILSEEGNDTLENHMCPNAGSSAVQTAEWRAVYAPPITARLNSWAPGANLTDSETSALISLCAFHTAASASATDSTLHNLSPFCSLFTQSDFAAYDYGADLDKYYYTGYGAALGSGACRAWATRTSSLRGSRARPYPATFPLDRAIYADFSHDNTMVAIFGALGLFVQPRPLSTTKPDAQRTWRTHEMVPFSGRMVVEKLVCGSGLREYVRILVNDALQPLSFCAADGDALGVGLCTLAAFVQSQSYARSNGEGDWERCFS